MTLLWCSIFLLVHLSLNSCPASYNPIDVRTGFVVASTSANVDLNIRSAVSSYVYSFNTSMGSTPQVAIATNMIEGPLRSGQKYWISALSRPTQITFTFNISYSDSNWNIIKIGFLAETRQDMDVGILQIGPLKNQPSQYNQTLIKAINSPRLRTFVSGFAVGSTQNSPIGLEIVNATVIGNNLVLFISGTNIDMVWISYIVSSSDDLQASYLVSSGAASLGIQSTNTSDFEAGTTYIYGFSEFQSSNFNQFQIQASLGIHLELSSSSKTLSSFTIDYFVIENLPTSYCSLCNSGNIYDIGYCVPFCSSDSVPVLSEGIQVCLVCDITNYLIVGSDNSSCECAVQYYQPSGKSECLPCHPSCISCQGPAKSQCLTCDSIPPAGTNKILVNGSCQCLDRFYADQASGYFCAPCHYSCLTCSGPTITNCQSCSVNLGRVRSGNTCSCISGYRDDGSSQKCVCIKPNSAGICLTDIPCQVNQISVNNSCQCKPGFFNISSKCSECPSKNYFNGLVCVLCKNGQVSPSKSSCVCSNNFFNISGSCSKCPKYEQYNKKQQTCVCQSRFYRVDGECKRPPKNTKYNGTDFVCVKGFYNISGKCKVCPGDQVYNGKTQNCACPKNTVLRGVRCLKPPNNNPKPPTNNCPQQAIYNGQTCLCPKGSSYNEKKGICTLNSTTTGPMKSVDLSLKEYLNYSGYIVASVVVSYIPPAILKSNCPACSSLLDVKITGGNVNSSQTLFSFMSPNIIKVFFKSPKSGPIPFTAVVKINPTNLYTGYDMSDTLNLNITKEVLLGL